MLDGRPAGLDAAGNATGGDVIDLLAAARRRSPEDGAPRGEAAALAAYREAVGRHAVPQAGPAADGILDSHGADRHSILDSLVALDDGGSQARPQRSGTRILLRGLAGAGAALAVGAAVVAATVTVVPGPPPADTRVVSTVDVGADAPVDRTPPAAAARRPTAAATGPQASSSARPPSTPSRPTARTAPSPRAIERARARAAAQAAAVRARTLSACLLWARTGDPRALGTDRQLRALLRTAEGTARLRSSCAALLRQVCSADQGMRALGRSSYLPDRRVRCRIEIRGPRGSVHRLVVLPDAGHEVRMERRLTAPADPAS
jgi:hypothetical protein